MQKVACLSFPHTHDEWCKRAKQIAVPWKSSCICLLEDISRVTIYFEWLSWFSQYITKQETWKYLKWSLIWVKSLYFIWIINSRGTRDEMFSDFHNAKLQKKLKIHLIDFWKVWFGTRQFSDCGRISITSYFITNGQADSFFSFNGNWRFHRQISVLQGFTMARRKEKLAGEKTDLAVFLYWGLQWLPVWFERRLGGCYCDNYRW